MIVRATPVQKRKEAAQAGGFAKVKLPGQANPLASNDGAFGTKLPASPIQKRSRIDPANFDPNDVAMQRGPDNLPESAQSLIKGRQDTNLVYKGENFSADKSPTYQARAYNNPDAGRAATALTRRFDLLRNKAEGQASLQQDQANSAIDRGAAARGRLGSGNVVKQRMLAQKELAGQREGAINAIEADREVAVENQAQQEANRRMAFDQEEAGRAFQSGEALGQRNFAAREAAGQRNFEGRNIVRDQNFKNAVFNQQNAQFREQMDQAAKQFELDTRISEFNMKMAKNAGKGSENWLQEHLSKGGTAGELHEHLKKGGTAGKVSKDAPRYRGE